MVRFVGFSASVTCAGVSFGRPSCACFLFMLDQIPEEDPQGDSSCEPACRVLSVHPQDHFHFFPDTQNYLVLSLIRSSTQSQNAVRCKRAGFPAKTPSSRRPWNMLARKTKLTFFRIISSTGVIDVLAIPRLEPNKRRTEDAALT